MGKISFALIGGDARQEKLAESLSKGKNLVYTFALKKKENNVNSLREVLEKSKCILFPMPISKNNKDLYAPFSERKITLEEIKNNKDLFKYKFIFAPGLSQNEDKFLEGIVDGSSFIFKYCTEDFLVKNADLTAKAAIIIAKSNLDNLKDLKILICGFGRLGKALAYNLKDDCKNLKISARKDNDFYEIKKLGFQHINTSDIFETSGYNLIFNTIPSLIFDENVLKSTVKDAFLIDLASKPGGADKKAVEKLKINYIHALGLPGKFYPKESGELIKDGILKIIKDKNLDIS